ncbi:MAG: phosphodiester glycosidase family protein [Clostridia bacterium]|nr:phosphodiester glycosidase family protein [Clostridia bacterium]
MRIRWIALGLLILLLPLWAAAEGEFPALNAEGFLDEGEFVYEGEEEGVWRYVSQTLKVEIVRRYTDDPKPLYWWEADVWTRGGEDWFMATAKEGKHLSTSSWPYLVAQKHKVVFAINNDYAQGRYPSKSSAVGIIIRDGKILWKKTRGKQSVNAFPNLDIMAFMPDGSLQVFDHNEHTAQEYLDMGVRNCLCFGPWLIRDGEVNTEALKHLGLNRNPRTAIGMVENGHYVAIVAEGRTKRSKGCNLQFMTDRLLEKGCSVGFNLDGGETSFMTFMGVQLNVAGGANNKYGSARRASDIVAIGVSDLVTERTPAVIKK